MPRIPAILSLGLLTACAGTALPTAETAPPPVRFFQAAPTKARFQPPPTSKLSFDPVEEERAREQPREEQEEAALREAMRLFQEFVDLGLWRLDARRDLVHYLTGLRRSGQPPRLFQQRARFDRCIAGDEQLGQGGQRDGAVIG